MKEREILVNMVCRLLVDNRSETTRNHAVAIVAAQNDLIDARRAVRTATYKLRRAIRGEWNPDSE